ncbi:MAG: hypothetical protein IPK30_04180 [Cellvibrionales bacterium]|nr:hypothetical protein [Cellvibrionales bacterium]
MNEDIAIALSLFGTIVTWALAWLVVVDHCNKQGGNLFVSHLLGIFIGSGAAFGAFCVTGALFLPNDSANTAIGIGIVGAAILSVYWLAFLFSKRTVVRQQQNKTVDYEAMRQKNDAAQRQKAESRAEQEKILRMPMEDFYSMRLVDHMAFWCVMLFLTVWVCLILIMLSTGTNDSLALTIGSTLWMLLIFYIFGITRLHVIPVAISVLLATASTLLEIWWRLRDKVPYAPPPQLPIDKTTSTDYMPSPPPPKIARKKEANWMFPFAMGLWLGHMWGDDD